MIYWYHILRIIINNDKKKSQTIIIALFLLHAKL